MNVVKMFEQLVHIEPFDKESFALLERMMNLDNPMKFDEDFASEEDLDRLEGELNKLENKTPQAVKFKKTVQKLLPRKTDVIFI